MNCKIIMQWKKKKKDQKNSYKILVSVNHRDRSLVASGQGEGVGRKEWKI
jgi:hypothetical protein